MRANEFNEKDKLRAEGRKMIIDMMRKKAADGTRGIYYAMYHIDEWGFKLKDWPEIREMIDARKNDIMVDILRGMKHNGKDGMSSARFTLERMRRIGVNWPDLDVIGKSLGSTTEIAEGRFDAEERIMAKEYVEDLPSIADSPNDCMYVFQFAHGHEVLFGPSLKQFFDPHREIWIRFLLENIKDGFHFNVDELENAVGLLRRMGIRWPELDTIEKSFRASKQIKEADDEDYEHDGEETEYGREWRQRKEFGEHLSTLYHDLQAKNWDMIPLVLQELGILDIEYVLPPRAKAMINDNKHQIMFEILTQMKQSRHPTNMSFAILALDNIGIHWPELDTISKSLASEERR